LKTINGRKYHHSTDSDHKCGQCGRYIKMYWKDKEESNGFSEQRYGFDKVCHDCVMKNNNNRPPLGLADINNIRKRGISYEQYYKENGY